jgi:hypothetical protein
VLHTIINARLARVARNEIWPKLTVLNDREIEMLTWVARGKPSALYITPFMTARMSVRRLPPPRLAGGISGSTYPHSLGYLK